MYRRNRRIPEGVKNSKEQIDKKWKDVKDCLQKAANEVLFMKSKQNKNKWMTKDILHTMEQRKKYKNNNNSEYR